MPRLSKAGLLCGLLISGLACKRVTIPIPSHDGGRDGREVLDAAAGDGERDAGELRDAGRDVPAAHDAGRDVVSMHDASRDVGAPPHDAGRDVMPPPRDAGRDVGSPHDAGRDVGSPHDATPVDGQRDGAGRDGASSDGPADAESIDAGDGGPGARD